MTSNLTMKYVNPEEKVIQQSEKIMDLFGNFDEDTAFFYLILEGQMKIKCTGFNKKTKGENG